MSFLDSRKSLSGLLVGGLLALIGTSSQAAAIYVLGGPFPIVQAAKDGLIAIGNTVTSGGVLASYSGYDQVWDLRLDAALTAADVTAMGSYLQGGGRMLLSGDNAAFSFRNNSLVTWAAGVGAGTLAMTGDSLFGIQDLTAQGLAVGLGSDPNSFTGVNYAAANAVTAAGLDKGFLATAVSDGSKGSLVGWDFGDITGASSARMLMSLDIEIFGNGQDWTENMYTYLAEGAANGVPEPSALWLSGIALAALAVSRKHSA